VQNFSPDHNIITTAQTAEIMTNNDYFIQVCGHSSSIELLTQASFLQRIAPAYLFFGPAGVGKALVARCWVEMLLSAQLDSAQLATNRHKIQQGNHPDLLWVQPTYNHQGQLLSSAEAAAAGVKKKAPPQIRIEQIRQITQFLAQPPLIADRAIVVIEQAETMAEGAANALLKTLEEPGKATLILLTDRIESLLPTLISRCQRIPFRRLDCQTVQQILIKQEYIHITQDPVMMAVAPGSPGQLIELWENLQTIPPALKLGVSQPIANITMALQLAKQIDRDLDNIGQIALLEYLQFYHWQQHQNSQLVAAAETSRRQLLAYVQPRLVWEGFLLQQVSDGS
jgi:DNA polymerase III subunit delta'